MAQDLKKDSRRQKRKATQGPIIMESVQANAAATKPREWSVKSIGVVRSCFKQKMGIPRQPGLIPASRGTIELLPPYNQPDAVRGLDKFSHIFVHFIFHKNVRTTWNPLVRPPRLGGAKKLGVFSTRSSFRPNPLGLSVVKLEKVRCPGKGQVLLDISGLDLVDGTPVIDIKPYVPYADSIPAAVGGFAKETPKPKLQVMFSKQAEHTFQELNDEIPELKQVLTQSIGSDPRPAYKFGKPDDRVYDFLMYNTHISWTMRGLDAALVVSVTIRDPDDPAPCRRQSIASLGLEPIQKVSISTATTSIPSTTTSTTTPATLTHAGKPASGASLVREDVGVSASLTKSPKKYRKAE